MSSQTAQQQIEASPGQLVEHLVQFDGSPEEFLVNLLAVQCHVGSAENGAILRVGASQEGPAGIEVLSLYPPVRQGQTTPSWLSQAVEIAPMVLSSKRPRTTPLRAPDELYGAPPNRYLVLLPIWGKANVRGVAGFVVADSNPAEVEQRRKRLELTITLLSLYELRLTLQRRKADLQRLRQSCEVLTAINEQSRFAAVAMAMCNQIASAWGAERVAVGLLKGRYVKLQALSHTEKFTRKMELVQKIETAMEECLDQDVEVFYPAPEQTTTITRSAKELSLASGQTMVLNLPLRRGEKTVGVLTIERPADKPFELEEVESLRLACDLCTARLAELSERDQWFGARLAVKTRKVLAAAVGPQYTWAKVAAVLTTALILFATLARGTYRVESSFVVEAVERQTVAAPFEGFLLKSTIRPGDKVEQGQTVLAELDSAPLKIELAQASADRDKFLTEARIQRRDNKIAEAQVAEAEAAALAARMDRLNWQIERAKIVAPLTGMVMRGDLTKELGAPVQQGQPLFEVAPLNLHAELSVPEGAIADLKEGQQGYLASVSNPGDYIVFTIERIEPVAQVVEQKNIYKVRVKLDRGPSWMRPGMEGVAKVDVDQRSHAWIWTIDLINWVRMKLWI